MAVTVVTLGTKATSEYRLKVTLKREAGVWKMSHVQRLSASWQSRWSVTFRPWRKFPSRAKLRGSSSYRTRREWRGGWAVGTVARRVSAAEIVAVLRNADEVVPIRRRVYVPMLSDWVRGILNYIKR